MNTSTDRSLLILGSDSNPMYAVITLQRGFYRVYCVDGAGPPPFLPYEIRTSEWAEELIDPPVNGRRPSMQDGFTILDMLSFAPAGTNPATIVRIFPLHNQPCSLNYAVDADSGIANPMQVRLDSPLRALISSRSYVTGGQAPESVPLTSQVALRIMSMQKAGFTFANAAILLQEHAAVIAHDPSASLLTQLGMLQAATGPAFQRPRGERNG